MALMQSLVAKEFKLQYASGKKMVIKLYAFCQIICLIMLRLESKKSYKKWDLNKLKLKRYQIPSHF